MTPTKREYGSGSITWLTNTKAQLRVWIDGVRLSKVVIVPHKNHGGRGAAAEELTAFSADVTEDLHQGGSVTLNTLLTEYRSHLVRIGRAQGTVEQVDTVAKRIPDTLGSIPIAKLGAHDLDTLYGELSLRLANNTVRVTHAMIHAALAQAIKWGWIASNPADGATPPKAPRSHAKPLPVADVRRMVTTALEPHSGGDQGDAVLAMAIAVAALTGGRRGELCGLRWDDFNPEDGSLTIQRQIVAGDGGQYVKDNTKSALGERKMYLGDVGLAVLERYRHDLRLLTGREPEGWLLSYDGGSTPLQVRALSLRISRLGKRCGLDVTTHSFRKVHATQLVAAGVDVDTAARRMGHTTNMMLSTYALGAGDKAKAAGGVIEARLVEQGLGLAELFGAKEAEFTTHYRLEKDGALTQLAPDTARPLDA